MAAHKSPTQAESTKPVFSLRSLGKISLPRSIPCATLPSLCDELHVINTAHVKPAPEPYNTLTTPLAQGEVRVTPKLAAKSPAPSVLHQNVMTMTMVMTSSPRMLLTFLLTSVTVGTLLVRGSHGCKTDECADLHAQTDFAWTSYSGMWIAKYVSNPMPDEENHGNIVDLEYSPNGKWRVKEYVGTKEGGCDILYWDCENPLGVGITNCTANIDGSRVQGVITIVATDYHTTAAVKVESRFVEHLYLMVRPNQALSADVISNQLKPCGDCIDPSSSFYKSMPDIVSICNLQ